MIAPVPESAVIVDSGTPAVRCLRLDLGVAGLPLDLDDQPLASHQVHDEVGQVAAADAVLSVRHYKSQMVVLDPLDYALVCVEGGRSGLLPGLGVGDDGVQVALVRRPRLAPGKELYVP